MIGLEEIRVCERYAVSINKNIFQKPISKKYLKVLCGIITNNNICRSHRSIVAPSQEAITVSNGGHKTRVPNLFVYCSCISLGSILSVFAGELRVFEAD